MDGHVRRGRSHLGGACTGLPVTLFFGVRAVRKLYGLSTSVCDLLTSVQVLEEMLIVFNSPITVLTDSRGARLLTDDCAVAARTRHIHRRWYFVRYHVEDGRLVVSQIRGSLNHANFLTKAVGGASFADDRAYAMGLRRA